MPVGFWHHMEYKESGFLMSLRAMQNDLGSKLDREWKLFGMRSIDTLMQKTVPQWWHNQKRARLYALASKEINQSEKLL